jgi:[ribosomal protein S5]-alanine N-acetyltransferase
MPTVLPVEIVTPRLKLRPLTLVDVPVLLPLFNDWAVIEWLSAPPWPYFEIDMRIYVGALLVSTAPDREIYFVIECDGVVLGGISWRFAAAGKAIAGEQASHQQEGPGPNIGFWLGTAFWGRGYMTEALVAVVQHLFTTTAVNALYSSAFDGNPASLRVQEKVGFTRTGRTLLASSPKRLDLPQINTVLTRAAYETLKRSSHALSRPG